MIYKIINDFRSEHNFNFEKYVPISSKTALIKCVNGKCLFLKKTELYSHEKYNLLYNQGVQNVLYPYRNSNGEFVKDYGIDKYLISDYYKKEMLSEEYLSNIMIKELETIHFQTRYKKVLSPKKSRKKMEEIYEYLLYKFNLIEVFVRSVECSNFNENSILVLKNYQYILDTKKIMAIINKKLIVDIKNNKSIYYSFIHNNPKNNHLIINNGVHYLISLEKSKMGIPSLDIVKFYIENENLNIDIKQLIIDYFNNYEDDFYINYFYFFVMLYYIKGIVIINNDYITSQSIAFASNKLKEFINRFSLDNYK